MYSSSTTTMESEQKTEQPANPKTKHLFESWLIRKHQHSTNSFIPVADLPPKNDQKASFLKKENNLDDIGKCIFCRTVTSHPSSNCMATPLKMKWKLIESTDICCRCLRGYHKPSKCISKKKCKNCRGLHATIMKCLRCGTEGHVEAVFTVSTPVFNSLNMTQSYSGVHFLDSVSSAHYQIKVEYFSSIQPMNGVVETASGEQCKIIGIGDAMNVQSCQITSKIGSQSLLGHPSETVLKTIQKQYPQFKMSHPIVEDFFIHIYLNN
ncbi:hypothetical protein BLOT_016059 [Blomia tropicalis]|nr:hypothetical protein BLOT_016059 [Blomia tropicalis]